MKDLTKVADRADNSDTGTATATPALSTKVPIAEVTRRGLAPRTVEGRVLTYNVDPVRVRAWSHHDRTAAWFTREGCQDLIDSIQREGQRMPALARKLKGDPDYDYELIYGARRRYACEVLNKQLIIQLTEADDATCAVLMASENTDRTDVTPYERALNFQHLLDSKVFESKADMSRRIGIADGPLSRSLKAVSIEQHPSIKKFLTNPKEVPLDLAYKLAMAMDADGATSVVLAAAKNLARPERAPANAAAAVRRLIASLSNTKALPPATKRYVVGKGDVTFARTPKGKLTISFAKGIQSGVTDEFMADLKKALINFTNPVQ